MERRLLCYTSTQMYAFSIATALLLGAAAQAAPEEPALHTVAELNAFSEDTRRRYTPFCITGTVQGVAFADAKLLVLSDPSGWAEVRSTSDYLPAPGETVALAGHAHMSTHQEIDIVANEITPIGREAVAPPLELSIGDISEERHHLRTVVTHGTVCNKNECRCIWERNERYCT